MAGDHSRSIGVITTDTEGKPDTLARFVSTRPEFRDEPIHTTRAEKSQTIAERKLNASAAFQRAQSASPLKRQDQILPQGRWWIASTRTPNAANQAKEIRTSTIPC